MNDYCNHLYDNTTDGYIQILNIDQSKKLKYIIQKLIV